MKPAHGVRQRRRPHQERSTRRVQQILAQTARLLEREGPNRLTTNLVARELGVSVGTLYHYFPNKHSILHVLGANWLDAWQRAFDTIAALTTGHTTVAEFVDLAVDNMLPVYRSQRGVQHLVQAMFTIPELRALDEHSDELAVRRLTLMFRHLRVPGAAAERGRLARLYLKISNTLLLETIRQEGSAARRTLADLKLALVHLLRG